MADIPGLIRGAHLNRGLGFAFLRHVRRCTCLVYVLDLSTEEDPWEQLQALRHELEQYEPGLSERPAALIANKLDLPIAQENLERLRERLDKDPDVIGGGDMGEEMGIFAISARKGTNVKKVLVHLRELYEKHKNAVSW